MTSTFTVLNPNLTEKQIIELDELKMQKLNHFLDHVSEAMKGKDYEHQEKIISALVLGICFLL